MSKICFAVGWEDIINSYPENNEKNLIQLYEDLFSKEITIVNKKLIVSDRSA